MDANLPLIVGFVADLMFQVQIEEAAGRLGYQVRWIEAAGQLSASASAESRTRVPGEPLSGEEGALVETLSNWQPALLIFDLGNPRVPWKDWIELLTSAPATRRIPVICFGSHVDTNAFKTAAQAGATAVLARSRFVQSLPELISKHARVTNQPALADACREPLSLLALNGLELFNRGEYFEAHEELELAWNQDQTPARELYRAVLQVAVAYLQIERGNYNGAAKMFLRLRQWIDPLPDSCRGVDVAQLRRDAFAARDALLALGPERIAEFDRGLFKPVVYFHQDIPPFNSPIP